MTSKLHLVTTCTDRKAACVPDVLRIRSLPDGGIDERATEWIKRLNSWPGSTKSALNLYAGELWAETRRTASHVNTLSVVSAGYGLISAGTEIHPYSATFQANSPDSVAGRGGRPSVWWEEVNSWDGPSGRRPTLGSLAKSGVVLIAASPSYLSVLEDEVAGLDPDRVLVISAGAPPSQLSEHRLPASGRARLGLGGSLVSVNARLARFLIETLGKNLNRRSASTAVQRLLESTPALPQQNRRRLDDTDVVARIAQFLKQDPSTSPSAAHRRLRVEGIACEQRRFRVLFNQALTRPS